MFFKKISFKYSLIVLSVMTLLFNQKMVFADSGRIETPPTIETPPSPPPASPRVPVLSNFYYAPDATRSGYYALSVKIESFGAGTYNEATCEYSVQRLTGVSGVPPRPIYATEWVRGTFTYSSHEAAYYCMTSLPYVDLTYNNIPDALSLRVRNSAGLVTSTSGVPTLDATNPRIGDGTPEGDFQLSERVYSLTATRGSEVVTFVPRRVSFYAQIIEEGSGLASCAYSTSADSGRISEGAIINPIPDPAGSGSMIGSTCLFENVTLPNRAQLVLEAIDHVMNKTTVGIPSLFVVDDQAPHSNIEALPEISSSTSIPLIISSGEAEGTLQSGVGDVYVFYHYRASLTDEWSPVYQYGDPVRPVEATTRVLFNAPSGNGYYEFFSNACDWVQNCESQPSAFDAKTQVLVSTPSPQANLAVSPGPLSFSNVLVGQSSAAQTLVLRNSGTAVLNVSSIQLSGDAASQFVLSGCSNGLVNLEAAQSCELQVTFRPTSLGEKVAGVRITSNTGGTPGNVISVVVSGTGQANTAPYFELSLASPTSFSMNRNSETSINVQLLRRNGFAGEVVLNINTSDSGLSAEAVTIAAGSNAATLTLHAASSAELGSHSINVVGTGSGLSHSVALSIGVDAGGSNPPPGGSGGGCSVGGVASYASSSLLVMMQLLSLIFWRFRR